jgi:Spy/CpxP family protein refolding chaperone
MNVKRILPVLCAVLLLATAVWAERGSHDGHRMRHGGAMSGEMHERMAARLAKALDLTAAQQTAWKELRTKEMAAMKPLFDSARQKHEAIRDGLDNNADAATVGQLMIDAHRIREQIRAAHEETQKELTALLTPDQAAKFEQLREKFHHGRGDGDGPEDR